MRSSRANRNTRRAWTIIVIVIGPIITTRGGEVGVSGPVAVNTIPERVVTAAAVAVTEEPDVIGAGFSEVQLILGRAPTWITGVV